MFPALTPSLLNECKTNPWTGVDTETIWQEWTLDVGNGEWVLGQITKSHITHRVHHLMTLTFVFTFCWASSKQNVLLDWDGMSVHVRHSDCVTQVFFVYYIHDYHSLLHWRLYNYSPRQSLRGYSVNILFLDDVGFGTVYRTAVISVIM